MKLSTRRNVVATVIALVAAPAFAAPGAAAAQFFAWIPEPFTMATLAVGAVCLLLRRRAH